MELIVVIIGIGLSLLLNVIAIFVIHSFLEDILLIVRREHKKTRKESQEIKSRLTQVRKDLNVIERFGKTKSRKGRI